MQNDLFESFREECQQSLFDCSKLSRARLLFCLTSTPMQELIRPSKCCCASLFVHC